jgi:kynurenine formamidase
VTLVDLTVPIVPGMPHHPVHHAPELNPYARHEDGGWRATTIIVSSHLGTHVDAPSHYLRDGATLEHLRIEDLVGPAEVVRLGGVAPLQELTPNDLPPTDATRLLLHTGWLEQVGDNDPRYFTEYPSITPALAHELIARGVVLIGLDSPSVDYDPGETHHILLGAGVVIVENLTGLEKLPSRVDLTVLPLPIVGGDGCPARAIASFDGPPR